MENKDTIISICQQLCKITERICFLADGIESIKETNADLADTYEHFLIDEITHVQIATLELTRAVTGEETANGDDSAFMEGELNSVIGEKEKEEQE